MTAASSIPSDRGTQQRANGRQAQKSIYVGGLPHPGAASVTFDANPASSPSDVAPTALPSVPPARSQVRLQTIRQMLQKADATSISDLLRSIPTDHLQDMESVALKRDLSAIQMLAASKPQQADLASVLAAYQGITPRHRSRLEEALQRVGSLVSRRRLLGVPRQRAEIGVDRIEHRCRRAELQEQQKIPIAVRSLIANARAPSTQKVQQTALRAFARCGFDPLHSDVTAFLIALEKVSRTCRANTTLRYADHVIGLVRLRQQQDFRSHRLVKAALDGLRRRGDTVRYAKPIAIRDVVKVAKSIDRSTRMGWRDYLLLLFAFAFGLRAQELTRLQWNQLTLPAGERLQIWSVTKVSGNQLVPLDCDNHFFTHADTEVPALSDLLESYRAFMESGQGPLWPQIVDADEVQPLALTAAQFRGVLRRRFQEAEVAYQSPHCFRAGCVTELARRGCSILQIGRTTGQRSPAMVAYYARLAEVTPP